MLNDKNCNQHFKNILQTVSHPCLNSKLVSDKLWCFIYYSKKPVCKDNRAKTFNDVLFKSQTLWTSSRAQSRFKGKTDHIFNNKLFHHWNCILHFCKNRQLQTEVDKNASVPPQRRTSCWCLPKRHQSNFRLIFFWRTWDNRATFFILCWGYSQRKNCQ